MKVLEEAKVENEELTESYLEFVAGKWYYTGDRIAFEGKNYECIAPEGVVCVWSPLEYPVYWVKIEGLS